MIGVDMKGLIDKLNGFCVQVLNTAAGMAVNREHYEVTFEHFLLALLEEKQSDLSLVIQASDCDADAIKREVARTLSQFRSGNTGRPVFSPALQDILEAGWLISSVDLNCASVRSGGVLLAFLKRSGFYAQGDYTSLFRSLDADSLARNFASLTRDSCENEALGVSDAQSASGAANDVAGSGGARQGFIERFCEDFTAKARAGKVDPVFGRDQEIRQMVAILARRRKNNPILVGEPGVGKTAVMEGLALRISEGDVPQTLKDTTLLNLDMGLLEAGASVKGEFERRLKGVLDEIKSSPKSIILFIDEAHLLVGGGASSGGSDAANLMKPALARGEIRTCAATTWKEYKKYFEKDAALARRFQLVKLDEPSVATTALILRGLRTSYEASHGVLVRDEAMDAAAEYSDRYISGRFLPDKAVDLLDTACARVKISIVAKPATLEDAQRRAQACMRQIDALKRDMEEGVSVDAERLAQLESELKESEACADQAENAWAKEKELAQKVLDARAALASLRRKNAQENDPEGAGPADPDSVKKAEEALKEARSELARAQGDNPLVSVEVTSDAIAQVVSDWTGIPVGKMARDQAGRISDLFSILSARIRGQDMALHSVVEGIQASKAGLRAPNQPMGVFLLVGPSGVGKTETGLALADALFGDERSVITINMSEFQEKHTVSRLIGSPPGYVGYGEGGLLTEAVRRKPYSVVLLDEVEKAHIDVMQLFYQVFDKGVLTDGEGTEISFRNTVIMLTSNLGSEITEALCENPEDMPDTAAVLQALRPMLSGHFQPALLARMTIVPYVSLTPEALKNIAVLKLNTLAARLAANSGMHCTFSDSVPAWLASRCSETETGARNIDYVLTGSVLPGLAKEILCHMADDCPPRSVSMDIRNEEICLAFDSRPDGSEALSGTEDEA